MKRKIAFMLAAALSAALLFGCGAQETNPTVATEASETVAQSIPMPATLPTQAGPHMVEAGTVNKHELGWMKSGEGEPGGEGIYFSLWTNEIPVDTTWSVRYEPYGFEGVTLYRDGVAHQIDGRVLKFDNTQWFLVLDNWLLGDLAPLQSGDTVLIFGEFLNDNGWSIHFEPTYFSLKGVDSVIISATPPTGIEPMETTN